MPKTSDVSRRIGRRVAELRHQTGRLQEDVARAARLFALGWTRATVAALETGRREVTLSEFFLLPQVLHVSCDVDLLLADLVPGPDLTPFEELRRSEPDIMLTPRFDVSASSLRASLRGGKPPQARPWMTEAEHERVTVASPGFEWVMDRLAEDQQDEAWKSSNSDACGKAARQLGVLAGVIGPASYVLWGRSFDAERDDRAAGCARPGASARTLQAHRGHATRSMLAELRPLLEEAGLLDALDAGKEGS